MPPLSAMFSPCVRKPFNLNMNRFIKSKSIMKFIYAVKSCLITQGIFKKEHFFHQNLTIKTLSRNIDFDVIL